MVRLTDEQARQLIAIIFAFSFFMYGLFSFCYTLFDVLAVLFYAISVSYMFVLLFRE